MCLARPPAVAAAVLAAQCQAVCGESLLDLFDRLLAKVRDRGQLVLGLHDQIADRLDADALQAVVGTDSQLELLDREILHPVSEGRLGAAASVPRRCGLAAALDPVEVGEDRELAEPDL